MLSRYYIEQEYDYKLVPFSVAAQALGLKDTDIGEDYRNLLRKIYYEAGYKKICYNHYMYGNVGVIDKEGIRDFIPFAYNKLKENLKTETEGDITVLGEHFKYILDCNDDIETVQDNLYKYTDTEIETPYTDSEMRF